MASLTKYAQTNTMYLAGSGVMVGATSATLETFTDIYGNVLTMTNFGTTGYITFEPDTTNEEAATFTGVTANANGTYTLTGVKTVLAVSPYTQTSGLVRAHGGGTKIVVTDNVAFWNTFTNKLNDETVTGQWTFTNTPIVPGTVSDASTVVKGVAFTSVAPATPTTPTMVETGDPRVPVQYAVDSGSANTYVITPSPVIIAYTAGQRFSFQATNANTTASTLNVNGLGAKAIKKSTSLALAANDILANQIVNVVYDGTNMQLVSSNQQILTIYKSGITTKTMDDASTTQTIAHGLGIAPKKVKLTGINSTVSTVIANSIGVWTATTQNCITMAVTTNTAGVALFAVSIYSIGLSNNISNPSTTGQTGVVTVDATNITITWTKNGSPSSTQASIMWEAEG